MQHQHGISTFLLATLATLGALLPTACTDEPAAPVVDTRVDKLLSISDSLVFAGETQAAIALQRQGLRDDISEADKARIYINMAWSYYFVGMTDSTLRIIDESIAHFDSIRTTNRAILEQKLVGLTLCADLMREAGQTPEALRLSIRAAALAKDLGEDETYIDCQLYILKNEEARGNYMSAIEGYQELLTYCDKAGHTGSKLNMLNSMQSIFLSIGDTGEASKYLEQMYRIAEPSNPFHAGLLLTAQMRYYMAVDDTQRQRLCAQQLTDLANDPELSDYSELDIQYLLAEYYIRVGTYDSAVYYLNILDRMSFVEVPERSMLLRAQINMIKGEHISAKRILDSIDGEELMSKDVEQYDRMLLLLSEYYYCEGDYHSAYAYMDRRTRLSNMLKTETLSHNFAYRNLTFSRDTTIISQRIRIQQQQTEYDQIGFWQSVWLIIVATIVVALLLMYFRLKAKEIRDREAAEQLQNEKLKLEILKHTESLKRQEVELQQKNSDLNYEIKYAGIIQNMVLPDETELDKPHIDSHFVFYRPCSTVSGDFYWFRQIDNKLFICCGDATGHGIPGAFIAMVSVTLLSDMATAAERITPLSLIEGLDKSLRRILQNNDPKQSSDSVDMSMLCIDTATGRASISLARHSAHIARTDGTIERVAGVKRSVGDIEEAFMRRKYIEMPVAFAPGDIIYLTSDGYESQICGNPHVGAKRLQLDAMIPELRQTDMETQKQTLIARHEEWKGSEAQTDDILVIGIKYC